MPYKILERNYQLQAQKRHEEIRKQDYYRRTAHYFERETIAAKQFNSWIIQGLESYASVLKKARQVEKLQSRRENLKQLLMEENGLYKCEIEKQKKMERQKNENLSFEVFHQKLLEKKAEEGFYYPTICQKMKSYTSSSDDTIIKKESLDIGDGDEVRTVTTNRQNQNYSISPSLERVLFQSINKSNNENIKTSKEYNELVKMSKISGSKQQNMRFSIRNIQQSLQDTNIRSTNEVDNSSMLLCTLKEESPTLKLNTQQNNLKYNYDSENHSCQVKNMNDTYQKNVLYCNQEDDAEINHEKQSFDATESLLTPSQLMLDELTLQPETQQKKSESLAEPMLYNNYNQLNEKNKNLNCHRRGNMQQKETDCAGSADISVQMFRYLQHNDLKRKILDLCKREHVFTIKQCWDEALRLREMRNELILLKNKNLYENQDLQIDDETRQFGLSMIKTREALNKKRVKMCNSMLYSDEAKALWKQWNSEDDEISKTELNTMKDVLLNELENEWKNLALRDKNRISQLYNRVMTKSDLQDEHKLAAVIRDANVRQKQYMNYLAT